MNETCPICGDTITDKDKKVNYHVTYIPEITTNTCTGCNWAEYLIRHPDVLPIGENGVVYNMDHRKEIVRQWTAKNRPLIT